MSTVDQFSKVKSVQLSLIKKEIGELKGFHQEFIDGLDLSITNGSFSKIKNQGYPTDGSVFGTFSAGGIVNRTLSTEPFDQIEMRGSGDLEPLMGILSGSSTYLDRMSEYYKAIETHGNW